MNKRVIPLELTIWVDDKVHKVFLKGEGGSSRTWARRYRNMIQHYEYLKANATNKQKRDELRGYEECMKNFYSATGQNSVLRK